MPKSVYSAKYQRFLRLLAAAREESGLTQVELAERIDWQQTDISKVERGERRLDVIEFLEFADALGADAPKIIRQLQERQV